MKRGRPVGSYKRGYPTVMGRVVLPLYSAWVRVCGKARRGVEVEFGWLGEGGYERFVEDVGYPGEGWRLVRKDKGGGYVVGNMRWERNMAEVARRSGESYWVVYRRERLRWRGKGGGV